MFANFTKPVINVCLFKMLGIRVTRVTEMPRTWASPTFSSLTLSCLSYLGLGSAMACRWNWFPPMLKPQSVLLRKLKRGSPHCWLKCLECNEFKTRSNALHAKSPIRYLGLWKLLRSWDLVLSSLSYLIHAFSFFEEVLSFLKCFLCTRHYSYSTSAYHSYLYIIGEKTKTLSNLAKVTPFRFLKWFFLEYSNKLFKRF